MSETPVVRLWRPDGSVWRQVAELDTAESWSIEPRFNQPGPWSLSMPVNDQAGKITERHAVTVDFRNAPRFTGLIEELGLERGEKGRPLLRWSGLDALSLLSDYLCFPDPANPVTGQTVARYKAENVAETALRNLVKANVDRRGDSLVVPVSQDRGATIRLSERFSTLLPTVQRKAERGGIGVRVGLVDDAGLTARMTVEFYLPADRSHRVILSPESGTLPSWSQSDTIPKATRAIVGGPGKGTARVMYASDPDAAAEARWGRKREVFVDARDVDPVSADFTSDQQAAALQDAATEALADGAAESSFDFQAVEAEGTRLGEHVDVGDLVTVRPLVGASKVVTLGAAQISASASDGIKVTLVPGDPDARNPLFGQAKLIRALRRRVDAHDREES